MASQSVGDITIANFRRLMTVANTIRKFESDLGSVAINPGDGFNGYGIFKHYRKVRNGKVEFFDFQKESPSQIDLDWNLNNDNDAKPS